MVWTTFYWTETDKKQIARRQAPSLDDKAKSDTGTQ